MHDQTIDGMRQHMEKSLHVFEDELKRLRTGRANPAMVEEVQVDYYGTRTPLKHLATITAPEPNLIVIRPYDKSQIPAIEKAILEANLGFNPSSDKEVVRITVPKLSEERRKELVKIIHQKGEETKVAVRNIRRHMKEEIERRKDEGEISEDDFHRRLKEIDQITHEFTEKIDQIMAEKEKQVTTV
jgi:ribosome recycling factor